MLTRDTTQGTTPDVLQHYLTAGIKMQSCYDDGTEEFEVLLLGLERQNNVWLARVQYSDEGSGLVILRHWLPVLRPFSALVTPLEDGTIPAVEVAKLEVDYPEYWDWNTAKVDSYPDILIVSVDLPGYPKKEQIYIHADWDCLNYKQVGYLRSKHFAVGLEAPQYIAKDPAPAPTTATIEKGTAGRAEKGGSDAV